MSQPNGVPVGFYLRTREYADEWFAGPSQGVQYLPLEPATGCANDDFVAVIPNGRIWGSAGCVVTPNHKILWDVSREWDPAPTSHSIFQQASLPAIQRTSDTVAVLTKIGSSNYYHWMFDVLPRIHLIRLSGVAVEKFVVAHPLLPYQLETLGALGIPRAKLLEADAHFHLQSSRLVVPSLPLEAKWACMFTRSQLLKHANVQPQKGGERLYITRKNCAGRTVVNESELTQALFARGFREIAPESMSVAEQVRSFSQAEIVVGPQGSGFTNLFFCAPATHVVELMCPTFWITSTEKICSYLNLDYRRVTGQAERNRKYDAKSPYWHGFDNIRVNVQEVIGAVDRALGLPQS